MVVTKNHRQNDAVAILNTRRLPGCLNTAQASVLLGFQEHDIAPLVAARLLVPLGKPAPNPPKYFAATTITTPAADAGWLGKATKAVAARWQRKNARTGTVVARARLKISNAQR